MNYDELVRKKTKTYFKFEAFPIGETIKCWSIITCGTLKDAKDELKKCKRGYKIWRTMVRTMQKRNRKGYTIYRVTETEI